MYKNNFWNNPHLFLTNACLCIFLAVWLENVHDQGGLLNDLLLVFGAWSLFLYTLTLVQEYFIFPFLARLEKWSKDAEERSRKA